jgi:hypothetical protein
MLSKVIFCNFIYTYNFQTVFANFQQFPNRVHANVEKTPGKGAMRICSGQGFCAKLMDSKGGRRESKWIHGSMAFMFAVFRPQAKTRSEDCRNYAGCIRKESL